jgi:hypothetical protein
MWKSPHTATDTNWPIYVKLMVMEGHILLVGFIHLSSAYYDVGQIYVSGNEARRHKR